MQLEQTIQRPLGITAFGSHVLGVEPDRATVSFSVVHIADRPERAFAEMEDSRKAVSAVLAAHLLAPADVTTSRVSMELASEGYGKDRVVLGYRARVDYRARTRDLGSVSRLVIELVQAGAREIHGVHYASSRLRELRAQAREAAFASARSKADGYARAAGVRTGRVLHIEDVNPDRLRIGMHGADVDLISLDELGAAPAGSIAVVGAVLVSFALVDS